MYAWISEAAPFCKRLIVQDESFTWMSKEVCEKKKIMLTQDRFLTNITALACFHRQKELS
jgi:hypothetical protein